MIPNSRYNFCKWLLGAAVLEHTNSTYNPNDFVFVSFGRSGFSRKKDPRITAEYLADLFVDSYYFCSRTPVGYFLRKKSMKIQREYAKIKLTVTPPESKKPNVSA